MSTASESKLLREARRVWRQLSDPVQSIAEARTQARYDVAFHDNVSISDGSNPMRSKACVFLIYQPDGLALSTFQTLSHLEDNGYAVLAVSNAPLSASDRSALLNRCSLLLERPNYGYDFGGYRDGIRVIRERDYGLERLLILNDSIWFPLVENDTLLAELEKKTAGLTGPVFERKEGRSHAGHFESYMMLAGSEALSHPVFDAYWTAYPISDRRHRVLKEGE